MKLMRLPAPWGLMNKLIEYASGNKGMVLYHNSLYEYRYDTKLNNYHSVDSIVSIGNIADVQMIDGKVFIILDCINEMGLDVNERYICFYRAVMEPGMRRPNIRRLQFTNLFAVDIIHINEDELTDKMELSIVEAFDS